MAGEQPMIMVRAVADSAMDAAVQLRCTACPDWWEETSGDSSPLATLIELAMGHAQDVHGIDEIRAENEPESRKNRAVWIGHDR